jgi:hypothetical protein
MFRIERCRRFALFDAEVQDGSPWSRCGAHRKFDQLAIATVEAALTKYSIAGQLRM